MKPDRPLVFFDPVAAGIRPQRPAKGQGVPVEPPSQANPARIAGDMLDRFEALPEWREFARECGTMQQWTNTPGWEDSAGKKTTPNAKPIGLAQWGAAMATAGLLTEAVRGAVCPRPGVEESGILWLNWVKGANEFCLSLQPGILQQTYRWRRVVDGMPREHTATDMNEVVQALRDFVRRTSTVRELRVGGK